MKKTLGMLMVAVLTASASGLALADEDHVPGKYHVYLMSGTQVDGYVTQLDSGDYELKTSRGIVMRLKKNQVKRMIPLEEAKPAARNGRVSSRGDDGIDEHIRRRSISDEEIEEILVGIKAEIDPEFLKEDIDVLEAPLPTDPSAVEEMIRQVGGKDKAKVLERPHFVMVYTSSDDAARKLGSRLESVWRWNAKFVRRLGLSPIRPKHKLEIFYFASWQEFEAYSMNRGTTVENGILGYYAPDINRSHFFDLWDMPMFQPLKKELEEGGRRLSPQRRRFLRNYITSWVEHETQSTIQHEAGHHIHYTTGVFKKYTEGGTAPTWLVEGATMQFEVPPSATGEGGTGLGELNDHMLNQFRRFPRWTAASLKIFVLHNGAWYQGWNYPRGWALVYYLWKQHRDGLGKYIRIIHDRPFGEEPELTDREREFEECFGRLDEKWVEDFYEFLDAKTVRRSRLPPDL
jgi:hypothetical protein